MSILRITQRLILLGCLWFTVFGLEIHNFESLATKNIGDNFALGLTLTEEEQSKFLSSSLLLESPGLCLIINGYYCDCYEGRITEIKSMPLFGCPQVINSFREQRSNGSMVDGFYFSVLIYDGWDSQIISAPVFIPLFEQSLLGPTIISSNTIPRDKITLVLPLTLNDLSRASLLMTSLRTAPADSISELIVVTPSNHKILICGALHGMIATIGIDFPLRCISESVLLPHSSYRYSGYAIQMAVKLLVARIVQTDFYMTLDADLICLHPSLFLNVFSGTKEHPRAVYHFESMRVHPSWWESSARILNISQKSLMDWREQHGDPTSEQSNVGIGVTPAILSTFGSLITVWEIIRQLYCKAHELDHSTCLKVLLDPSKVQTENGKAFDTFSHDVSYRASYYDETVHQWISTLGFPPRGYTWSEYTLYRLTLAKYQIFNQLHVSESMIDPPIFLHCNNVWFAEQWPWDAESAYQNSTCLFSVIQSTTKVTPETILPLMRT